VKRLLLHIPIGMLIGLASLIPFSWLGTNLVNLFLAYEMNEDRHIGDQAWKDIPGAIVGVAIITILAVVALTFLVIYLIGRFV
jgi:hypothetical protein